MSRTHDRFNALIMWELQIIQNFDKVVKFDKEVSYYNILIHNQMDHAFRVKIVKFSTSCVIFTSSIKNQNEITNIIVSNFSLKRFSQENNNSVDISNNDMSEDIIQNQ